MDAASTPPDFSELQRPLDQFRAKTRRLKIHPAEVLLLSVVGFHFVFLPWALGGMRPWAQIPSFVLSVIGLAIALIPRHYTEAYTGSNSFRLVMWPKLLRFPIFWLGLALLSYVTLQALNPAWTYETDGKGWWMRAIPHTSWLPTGVRVPFERWGPWRMLLVWASVWLTVCTIWIGFTRRRTLQFFFLAIAANGVALAVFGLAQQLLPNGKIFWTWVSPNPSFFSSFIYKNHAGAYLDLVLGVTCALAAWYYLRGVRRLEKSNPAAVLAFFALCIGMAILLSFARGATVAMLGFLTLCIAGFIVHQFRVPDAARKPVVALALISIFAVFLAFALFLKTGTRSLQPKLAMNRLMEGLTREDQSLATRGLATRASLEMLQEHWRSGAGAGSFAFLFPIYQQRHPTLFGENGARYFWEHAHNDIVEFPIELGVPGMLLLLGAAGYLGALMIRNHFWRNPLSAYVAFMLFLLVVYSWWDFPFHCPAVLALWCALAVALPRWTQFEEQAMKPHPGSR